MFTSAWTHQYVFYIMLLICCSNCSSFGHGELLRLPTVSLWDTSIIVCVLKCLTHPHFLAQQGAPDSSCIFPTTATESVLSLRSLPSFYQRQGYETNIASGFACSYGCAMALLVSKPRTVSTSVFNYQPMFLIKYCLYIFLRPHSLYCLLFSITCIILLYPLYSIDLLT